MVFTWDEVIYRVSESSSFNTSPGDTGKILGDRSYTDKGNESKAIQIHTRTLEFPISNAYIVIKSTFASHGTCQRYKIRKTWSRVQIWSFVHERRCLSKTWIFDIFSQTNEVQSWHFPQGTSGIKNSILTNRVRFRYIWSRVR